MASFDIVDYSIRPNKNVERKLFFEALRSLSKEFPIRDYRYVGFGGPWFVDFLVAHRWLGVSDLVSIEKDEIGISRALFNKPYSCVTVEEGESSEVLPDIHIGEKPLVAWLDYDQSFFVSSVLNDIDVICSQALSGSIVLVTLNCHTRQLDGYVKSHREGIESIRSVIQSNEASDEEKLMTIADIVEEISASKSAGRLRAFLQLVGNLAPVGVDKKDVRASNFSQTLSSVLFSHFKHVMLSSGREEEFVPLFNFSYKDRAPMFSAGGIIVNSSDREKLQNTGVEGLEFITCEQQYSIDLPPLTMKEKISLDQLLPSDKSLSSVEVKQKLDLLLKEQQLESYQRLYVHYPIFSEVGL